MSSVHVLTSVKPDLMCHLCVWAGQCVKGVKYPGAERETCVKTGHLSFLLITEYVILGLT